jgi:hypothetical protein
MYSFAWSICISELGTKVLKSDPKSFCQMTTSPVGGKLEEPITEPLGMAQLSGAIHRATKPIKHASVFD